MWRLGACGKFFITSTQFAVNLTNIVLKVILRFLLL